MSWKKHWSPSLRTTEKSNHTPDLNFLHSLLSPKIFNPYLTWEKKQENVDLMRKSLIQHNYHKKTQIKWLKKLF